MERANRTIYDRIRHCEVMTIQEIAFINNGQNQNIPFHNTRVSEIGFFLLLLSKEWKKKKNTSVLILDLD